MIDYRMLILAGVTGSMFSKTDDGKGLITYNQQITSTRQGDDYSQLVLQAPALDFKLLGFGAKKLKVVIADWSVTPTSLKTETFSFVINWFTGWGNNVSNSLYSKIDTNFPAMYNQSFTLYAPVRNGLSPRYLLYPRQGSFISNISENQTSVITIQLRLFIDVLEYGGVPSDDYRWY